MIGSNNLWLKVMSSVEIVDNEPHLHARKISDMGLVNGIYRFGVGKEIAVHLSVEPFENTVRVKSGFIIRLMFLSKNFTKHILLTIQGTGHGNPTYRMMRDLLVVYSWATGDFDQGLDKFNDEADEDLVTLALLLGV